MAVANPGRQLHLCLQLLLWPLGFAARTDRRPLRPFRALSHIPSFARAKEHGMPQWLFRLQRRRGRSPSGAKSYLAIHLGKKQLNLCCVPTLSAGSQKE